MRHFSDDSKRHSLNWNKRNSSVVEHNLAKVGVASSNLVSRSKYFKSLNAHLRAQRFDSFDLFRRGGRVVMQRTATPCTPVRFRPAPPFLHLKINKLPRPNLVEFLTQRISKLNPKSYPPWQAAFGGVIDQPTICFGRRFHHSLPVSDPTSLL